MDIRQNDSGFTIRATVKEAGTPIDVSTATCTLILNRPTGGPLYRVLVFTTDGTDGLVEYVAQPGDFDQRGTWSIQVRAQFPDPGPDLRSVPVELNVEASPV